MLQAIETTYKGYRFRSRLEARWAVFFDALKVRWEYEAQGYNLGPAGLYLPDFEIATPKHGRIWIEVKGQSPTGDELAKAYALAVQAKGYALIVSGTPGDETGTACLWHVQQALDMSHQVIETFWCFLFKLCLPQCAEKSICRPYFRAVQAARSARFEHGEHPR